MHHNLDHSQKLIWQQPITKRPHTHTARATLHHICNINQQKCEGYTGWCYRVWHSVCETSSTCSRHHHIFTLPFLITPDKIYLDTVSDDSTAHSMNATTKCHVFCARNQCARTRYSASIYVAPQYMRVVLREVLETAVKNCTCFLNLCHSNWQTSPHRIPAAKI